MINNKQLGLFDKIVLVINTIKNPHKIFFDKFGIVDEIIYKISNGQKVYARSKSTDINEAVVVLSGHEYPAKYFGSLKNNCIVVDCGGNIGLFALYARKILPNAKVFSLEPLPANILQFDKNLKINREEENVVLIPKGISVDGEDANFLLEGNDFDAVHSVKEKNSNTFTVKTITLSQLMKEYEIPKIDILKIDIEGGEYDLLTTGLEFLTENVKKIIVEYHKNINPNGRNVLVDYLTSKNSFQLEYETSNILVFNNFKIEYAN